MECVLGDLQEKLQKLEKKNEDGAGSSSNSESTLQASEHLVQHVIMDFFKSWTFMDFNFFSLRT